MWFSATSTTDTGVVDTLDFLAYGFMQRAFLAAIATSLLCSIIGVYIILKGLSFMGAGMAHAAFAGATFGIVIGTDPFLMGILFAVGTALGIGYAGEKAKLNMDAAIGILFSLMLALGIIFIHLMPVYNPEAYALLFGDVLGVSAEEIKLILLVAAVVFLTIFLLFKEFQVISFDPEFGRVLGIPVRAVSYILLVLIALSVASSIKVIGAILVFALITAPPAAAHQFTHKWKMMFVLSAAFGVLASIIGLLLSYYLPNMPSGPMIVLAAVGIFFLSMVFSRKKKHIEVMEEEKWKKTESSK